MIAWRVRKIGNRKRERRRVQDHESCLSGPGGRVVDGSIDTGHTGQHPCPLLFPYPLVLSPMTPLGSEGRELGQPSPKVLCSGERIGMRWRGFCALVIEKQNGRVTEEKMYDKRRQKREKV